MFCYFDTMHSGIHLIKIMRKNAQFYFDEVFTMLISWKII